MNIYDKIVSTFPALPDWKLAVVRGHRDNNEWIELETIIGWAVVIRTIPSTAGSIEFVVPITSKHGVVWLPGYDQAIVEPHGRTTPHPASLVGGSFDTIDAWDIARRNAVAEIEAIEAEAKTTEEDIPANMKIIQEWYENATPEEIAEMLDAQRASFLRAMEPCEHGEPDWETCPQCQAKFRSEPK